MYNDYVELNNLQEIMQDANEFNVERIKKLNEILSRGINPYPYSFDPNTTSTDIIDNFDNINEEERFILSGRIMLLRRMGKVTFLNLRDRSGNIQVYISKNELGEEAYGVIKLLDVGDIIGVEGTVFRTKTNEITVKALSVTVLSKSIRPLPEKYHGIQDADLRQRHRSLDMIMNDDVRDTFINTSQSNAFT